MGFSARRHRALVHRLLRATLLCCLLLAGTASADTLAGNWREARPDDIPAEVLREAESRPLAAFDPARMQVFPNSSAGTWVILRTLPPWTSGNRVLSIRTPGLGAVTLYDEHGRVAGTSLEDFGQALHGHTEVAPDHAGQLVGLTFHA